jgi:hypothetical protein
MENFKAVQIQEVTIGRRGIRAPVASEELSKASTTSYLVETTKPSEILLVFVIMRRIKQEPPYNHYGQRPATGNR